jgi:hypothetical protein
MIKTKLIHSSHRERHMKLKMLMAAAIACASLTAQAANDFGLLNGSKPFLDISLTSLAGGTFSETVTFTLPATSNVTGTLIGLGGQASLLDLSYQRFSEINPKPPTRVAVVQVGDVSTFNFGQLSAPSGIGFDSGMYTLNLVGQAAAGVSSVRLSLSAVPEASTWAMWALGLVGVAAVGRARRASPASA